MIHPSVTAILMAICMTVIYVFTVYNLPIPMWLHAVLALVATTIFTLVSLWFCRKVWGR